MADNTRAKGRVNSSHACAECQKRKIRCNGQEPCKQCSSSRTPRRCFYTKQRQRSLPSKQAIEAICTSRDTYRSIVEVLFPGDDASALCRLSRTQLLARLDRLDRNPLVAANDAASATADSPNDEGAVGSIQSSPQCDDWYLKIHDLEHIPHGHAQCDERLRERGNMPAVADDVNALSLSLDDKTCSSYLFASSVKAALVAISKVRPGLKGFLANAQHSTMFAKPLILEAPSPTSSERNDFVSWSRKGQNLVDAYFKKVHILIPMLDEASFRADYLGGNRAGNGWFALVNAVLAMGSIAATQSDNTEHLSFGRKALHHLPIESLGDGSIEAVQALTILGGFYLHYINRPNLADALVGAAFRIASALGLHREAVITKLFPDESDSHTADVRRRTWWTLFCVDTWANATTGRPSFGRSNRMINVGLPEYGARTNEFAWYTGGVPDEYGDGDAPSFVANIEFCKIATEIQDALATCPLLCHDDRWKFDAQLLAWYENLLRSLSTPSDSTGSLCTGSCIMKWRYQNLRMLLHRPSLLSQGMEGLEGTQGQCHAVDVASSEKCREVAATIINTITCEWEHNQISSWHGAWLLYQASFVPLFSIAQCPHDSRLAGWNTAVGTVIKVLGEMREWSPSAACYRDALSKTHAFLICSDEPSSNSPALNLDGGFLGQSNLVVRQFAAKDLSLIERGFSCVDKTGSAILHGFKEPFDESISNVNYGVMPGFETCATSEQPVSQDMTGYLVDGSTHVNFTTF